MNNSQLKFQVSTNRLIKTLVAILLLLLAINIAAIIIAQTTGHYSVYGLLPKFRFDDEQNIPTYFSAVILLISSALLYAIFHMHKLNELSNRNYWRILSILFLLLSIDEIVCFHELLISPSKKLFGITEGLFYFAWVIPGMLFCLILAVYFLRFFLNLPTRYKVLFGTSALVLISGAIGMEIVDGFFAPTTWSERTLIYDVLSTLEELLEMTGVILFIYSLIDYIKWPVGSIVISPTGK